MGEANIKSKIELAIENLSKAEVTHVNYEKYSRDIETINSMLDTTFEQYLKSLQKPNDMEDDEDRELKRQNKSVKDPQLAEKIANRIKDIRLEKITILDDIRENRILLNKLNYLAQAKFANALALVRGTDIAEKLTEKTIQITDSIFTRVDNLRVRDLARVEEMNQRILELHEDTNGRVVGKLDVVISILANAYSKPALNEKSAEYRKKEDDYESEIQELSHKEREAEERANGIKEDYEKKLEQESIDKEKIKKEYEAKIEALNKEISIIQSKEKTLNAKAVGVAASAEVLEKAIPKKEDVKYDEAYWKDRLKKKYPIALAIYQNGGDTKKAAEECGFAQGYVSNVKTYLKNNHLQRKFEEFVGTLDFPKQVTAIPAKQTTVEQPESETKQSDGG